MRASRRVSCAATFSRFDMACGAARAEPSWTMPQPRSVTTMSALPASDGRSPWHSRRCGSSSGRRSRQSERSAAISRAAMRPDAQAGAPGQATMRRRGSSAGLTINRAARFAHQRAGVAPVKPDQQQSRPGAGRTSRARRVRRAHATRSAIVFASAWPNGKCRRRARTPSSRRRMHPDHLRPVRGCRRGRIPAQVRQRHRMRASPSARSTSACARDRRVAAIVRSISTTTLSGAL